MKTPFWVTWSKVRFETWQRVFAFCDFEVVDGEGSVHCLSQKMLCKSTGGGKVMVLSTKMLPGNQCPEWKVIK
jgi:hypothetical protein